MQVLIGSAVVIVLLIIFISIGYVKAPPDTAYMISGFRKPRILIGKAGIRIPFLERLDKLSLKMFSVDVKTTDFVPNAEYINVKVDATVKIRIGQSEEMMSLASKFFLNESEEMIIRRVQDTLEGNMREIVGQMKLVVSYPGFARLVAEEGHCKQPVFYLPLWLAHGVAWLLKQLSRATGKAPALTEYMIYNLSRNNAFDSSKARQELGYTSRPFRETIRDEVQWLREGGYLKESE